MATRQDIIASVFDATGIESDGPDGLMSEIVSNAVDATLAKGGGRRQATPRHRKG